MNVSRQSGLPDTPDFPLVSWSVVASATKVREIKAHRTDRDAITTLCGVSIPPKVARYLRSGEIQRESLIVRVYTDTPGDTASKPRCATCERKVSRLSGNPDSRETSHE